eukprot:m.158630 g.158630  ORF g.158630 m.158630 type:complete len:163 (-) comp16335_c8_seq4:398-886(-)
METKKVVQRISLRMFPSQLRSPEEGIHESVQALLDLYNTDMNGVPVSYSSIKLKDTVAAIHEDVPVLHVQAKVVFQVFCPKVGDILEGIVNKLTVDHIGVLIFDKFNASIPSSSLPENVFYKEDVDAYVDGKATIAVGSKIRLQVKELETSHGVLSISGVLS